MSASTRRTLRPAWARATARFAATIVLPSAGGTLVSKGAILGSSAGAGMTVGGGGAEHLACRGVRAGLGEQFHPASLRLLEAEPRDGAEEGEVQILLQVLG